MLKIFLRLYIFLLLPITIFALLPTNPIIYFGNKLLEKHFDHEFSSVYQLVNAELGEQAESQWNDSIDKLAPYFPNGLFLKPVEQWKFKKDERARLYEQGFILKRKAPMALFYRVRDTDKVLRFNLFLPDDDFQILEKQTRGIRHFVNKSVLESPNVEQNFRALKPLFKIPLSLKRLHDFPPDGVIAKGLREDEIYYDRSEDDPLYIYFRGENINTSKNPYVIVAGPLNNSRQLQMFYDYAQFLVPALLIAIGTFLWLYTLMRELRTMNKGAKRFGRGDLDARVKLSRFSTLHRLSTSFNGMASKIQQLVNGHRDLTNAVSHELKTPLSRLRFALQMQQESSNKADKQKYTNKIQDNISELEELINELLNYARLDRNGHMLKIQKHNLSDWLTTEVSCLAEYHPELSIQLTFDKSANQTVSFDQSLMDKVLNNLLNNACRHAHKTISISARIEDNNVLLTIEDDGPGIDERFKEQLFQPFFRADNSRQRNTGGSGLGLAISQKIMKLHHGSISYHKSKLGGAKFLITWPM